MTWSRPRRPATPPPLPAGPAPPRDSLAVEITPADVQLIEQLFRHVQARRRRARFDMQHDPYNDQQREQLVSDLYTRMGAVSVVSDRLAIPLAEQDIQVIDKMRHDLDYANSYLPHLPPDPMLASADTLLARLRFLTGRARAIHRLGDVAVFRDFPELPAPETTP